MGRQKKQHLKRRSDGRYRCMYNGIYFYGSTEDEALEAREAYKKAEREDVPDVETVAEYAMRWLPVARPSVSPSTYRGLATHLQHLVDVVGNKQIDNVVPSDIKAVYSSQYADCSNSYLKSAKQLFVAMFDSAVADGLCRSNPARDRTAKPHKGSNPTTRGITQQEREWIETLCTDHRCHPAVMAMLYAGLRPPEAKALKIERDVDFENDVITLQEFAHNDADNAQKYAFTEVGKTDKAARQIPLFPPLKAALEGKKGYLITSAHGEQVTHTTWRVAWRSYCHCMETAINGMEKRWYGKTKEHKALLAQNKPLPEWISFDIVPYDLRHSFCVMCRDAGVEINTCRHWMGHADTTMILKVYDSVSEDRSAQERKKIEKSFEKGQNEGQTDMVDAENG